MADETTKIESVEPPEEEEEEGGDDKHGGKYQKRLIDSMDSSQDSYDKYLISLSTGALSLSLLFLDKLIDLHAAEWKACLFTAWIQWAIAICSTLLSFRYGQLAFERAYNDWIDKKPFNQSFEDRVTRGLNTVSGVSFITGVVFLIVFVIHNLAFAT